MLIQSVQIFSENQSLNLRISTYIHCILDCRCKLAEPMEVMLVPRQAASQSRLAPHTLSFALTLILEAEQGEENGRAEMQTERLEVSALRSYI